MYWSEHSISQALLLYSYNILISLTFVHITEGRIFCIPSTLHVGFVILHVLTFYAGSDIYTDSSSVEETSSHGREEEQGREGESSAGE